MLINQSLTFQMSKRPHEVKQEDDSVQFDDSSFLSPKKKQKKDDVNGVADKIDVWLVRKPRNVSFLWFQRRISFSDSH
jgi:hypothetical protein